MLFCYLYLSFRFLSFILNTSPNICLLFQKPSALLDVIILVLVNKKSKNIYLNDPILPDQFSKLPQQYYLLYPGTRATLEYCTKYVNTNYRVAALKKEAESRILLMEHKFPPPHLIFYF